VSSRISSPPSNIQALIWKEIVPNILVDSVLPRWWGIRPEEMHAAALYSAPAKSSSSLRHPTPNSGKKCSASSPIAWSLLAWSSPPKPCAIRKALPRSFLKSFPQTRFSSLAGFRSRFPDQVSQWGNAGRELNDLIGKDPSRVNLERLSKDFGSPHLAIAQSDSCTLLNLEIFPSSGAFQGRLFGESWESSNLYWARLADEMGYSPAMLNILVPNLTRRMVANIFATNIDDWPALLRALQRTGDEFRQNGANGSGAGTMTGQVTTFPIAAASLGSHHESGQE
jgi:hypothetical protein